MDWYFKRVSSLWGLFFLGRGVRGLEAGKNRVWGKGHVTSKKGAREQEELKALCFIRHECSPANIAHGPTRKVMSPHLEVLLISMQIPVHFPVLIYIPRHKVNRCERRRNILEKQHKHAQRTPLTREVGALAGPTVLIKNASDSPGACGTVHRADTLSACAGRISAAERCTQAPACAGFETMRCRLPLRNVVNCADSFRVCVAGARFATSSSRTTW